MGIEMFAQLAVTYLDLDLATFYPVNMTDCRGGFLLRFMTLYHTLQYL